MLHSLIAQSERMSAEAAQDSTYDGAKLLIFTGIFYPSLIVSVCLRYLARYLNKGSWGADDILVFSSLVLQTCMAGIAISKYHRPAASTLVFVSSHTYG
jgi:hypothetical protein